MAALIEAKELSKVYARRRGAFKKPDMVAAVSESTTARLLTGLEAPSGGEIRFDGQLASTAGQAPGRAVRRQMGMIFQDPYDSLNPGMRIGDIVGELIMVHEPQMAVPERRERVIAALEAADLRPGADYYDRFPHQISGGQRQRVAIARAMILNPQFVAADEPTSMLDVSVRAGILNSMLKLKEELGLTCLFITHDLTVARYMCDRIGVMYNGKIVEMGPTDEVIQQRPPVHPGADSGGLGSQRLSGEPGAVYPGR